MTGWAGWLALGLAAWVLVAVASALVRERVAGRRSRTRRDTDATERRAAGESDERRRVLVVDDDPALRLLLRTTLPASEFDVEEAESAESALEVTRFLRPDVAILDVGLPGADGLELCRRLKSLPTDPFVVLLSGRDLHERERRASGADAALRKPFSPMELLTLLDEGGADMLPGEPQPPEAQPEQLLLYARDLGRVVETERRRRRLLEQAYRRTVTALADALEATDRTSGLHGERVQRYAVELATAVDRSLLADPSLEYGFLLHDVGKIAVPEAILRKPGPLTPAERRRMQQHPLLGVRMLEGIPLLEGAGLDVVRSHHERWDGAGYPDGLRGDAIPLAARVFALADALDAITTDRPYRPRRSWDAAVDEILGNTGTQFDPLVVAAFASRERLLHRIAEQLTDRAA